MKILASLSLISLLVLGGCSSNKSDSTTSTTTPVTQNQIVHLIQPSDIPNYITQFKQLRDQLQLEFDGVTYPISLVDFDIQDKVIYAKYELGLALIGFDLEAEKPIETLTLLEGDTSDIENFSNTVTRTLTGSQVQTTQDGDNIIYQATMTDEQTQGTYMARLVFNDALISGGNSVLEINGDSANLSGSLGTNTYIQIDELIMRNPEVRTIVLKDVDGSVNDAINMHTGRLVRNAQLTTFMPADGEAYSGGVDLYAAGYQRKYETGGKLGVHSWCCVDGKPADQLGRNHSAHGAQLTYFRDILGETNGPEFYFFTIEAASFENVHVMTREELDKYKLITD
ncbi:hypothetical protein [Aliikangiella coralliicola]|uniref:Alpha/beta hydrolase n=1 Tax=Aliikangiella coralliicola TaxID=2592383 RepID=A0A545UCJ3_9GAMM|nr:hypothetical protein [Aliikangiella coralliicola]TQV87185.1 hypothetical protein FLL46_15390 [Aliikangiella coralliicola]